MTFGGTFRATPGATTGATSGRTRVAGDMPATDALTSPDVRSSSRLFTGSTNQCFFRPRYVSARRPETTLHDNVTRSLSPAHSAPRKQAGIIHFNLSFAKDEG